MYTVQVPQGMMMAVTLMKENGMQLLTYNKLEAQHSIEISGGGALRGAGTRT